MVIFQRFEITFVDRDDKIYQYTAVTCNGAFKACVIATEHYLSERHKRPGIVRVEVIGPHDLEIKTDRSYTMKDNWLLDRWEW